MNKKENNNNFEAQLFKAADKLRKNIDAAEYKNVALGLIFLKYISDSFSECYRRTKTKSTTKKCSGFSYCGTSRKGG